MSDACQEKKSEVPGSDDFGRAISRISVAQICESAGFQSTRRSAIDALADIAIRYICDLGRASHFYAGLSGRSDCNLFDIVQGLQDLGFGSASDVQRCLVSADVVDEITRYVGTTEEVPFARPLPKFPILRSLKTTPSFAQIGETPAGKHIPDWLPAFPDQHTYIHTPVWHERASDPRADKIEQARQRRKAENSLLSLQQRLTCNGTARSFPAIRGDAGKGKHLNCSGNHYRPLPYKEKIVIPDESAIGRRLPILETFAPVIDAAMTGPFNPGISERTVLPNRTKVRFRFGIDKKSIALPLSSIAPGSKTDFMFLRDDEKDDKKRRAEIILKEAMENPEELVQL